MPHDSNRVYGGSSNVPGKARSAGPQTSRRTLPAVPSKHEVIAGRHVSIILKADQPTGRQVSGIVSEVLTSGDHPRGIKVRLDDGRVGRVQAIQARQSETATDRIIEIAQDGITVSSDTNDTVESMQKPRYRDVRLDDNLEAPETEYDLFSFVKIKEKKTKKAKATVPSTDQHTSATAMAGAQVIWSRNQRNQAQL